jgi:FkbM family methyltransferase
MPLKIHTIFVLCSACICLVLVLAARHHPPSRRKIKEIWHGRVHWEEDSKTTMLRSSAEEALGSVEPKDPPHLLTVTKPTIALCAATHSKSNWRSLDDTALQNLLIPSIERTISTSDRSKYDFRLYFAADYDDEFWLQNENNVNSPDWLSVRFGFYDVPKHKIPFNPMMRAAYNDGAEYMVRINDDSEFVTSDWVSKAVAKLASYDPPNVGMVGPNCREGNTAIITHDMVHRTHLDIFEHYYPDVFSAWWIDDWISKVYGPERSTKMMDWTVKHHTHKHGTRYEVQHHEAKLLKGELEKGAVKIEAWLSEVLQQKSPNNFKIHVLTMNRAKSLQRLLDSLENAEYAGDRVEIYIHIDKSPDNRASIDVVKSFDFSHGDLTIEVAEQNNGLRNAWFRAWHPKENERAIILEDDIEVSPQWYFWLNKAWEAYGERDDLAGISLQRQTLVPQKPHKQMEIVNNHEPFLYRLVGSIGFSPHWKQWRAFLNWIDSVDTTTVNIKTPGLITSDWFDVLDKRHMWTQYFIWFCKQHDLYTLYVNLPERKTLASHMREKGEHYGRTEGRDFALATEVEMNFPLDLVKYGWDGIAKPQSTNVDCRTFKQMNPIHIGFMQSQKPYLVSFSWWDTGRHAEIKNDQQAHDNDSIRLIQKLLAETPSGSAFVDVGANVGFMTFSGAVQGHPTFAIDPISYNVAKLCEGKMANVDSGAFQEDMVHVIHAAAGAENKPQILMTRPADDVGLFSSLARTAVHQKKVTTETIPMVTIDSVVGEIPIGVVKIDVQGFEYGVIQGMKKRLENSPPNYVLYEEDPGMIREAGFVPGASQKMLESYGYICKLEGADILCSLLKNEAEVCLKGPAMGQTANYMVSIFHAIPTQGILGLDKVWSDFYNQWFEPHERVKLYFDGTCQTTISPVDSFYSEKTESRFNKKVWPLITLKHALLQNASEILASYDGPIATVHGRWLSGTCVERADTLNNFCTLKKENWKETCHYTQDSISKLTKMKPIVYMSDGQKPEYANTFENVDHHPFDVQFAMMVESEYHFGNPMSSIDYVVSKMRENKPTYPEQCFAEKCTFKNGMLSWKSNTNNPLSFNACSEEGCVPVEKLSNGYFQSIFDIDVSSVFVQQMWLDAPWSEQKTRDNVKFQWTGCDLKKTWVNKRICDFEGTVTQKKIAVSKKLSLTERTSFVGDSTMKRLFDAAVRKCPENNKFSKFGKLHDNINFQCKDIEYNYIWSSGFDDTSKKLLSIVDNSYVVFNTGHNYINMNDEDFERFVIRLKESTVKLRKWILIAPPASNAKAWTPDMRCMRNNVIVQKRIDIILKHFTAKNVIEMFWKTLQSGKAIDGIHYTNEVYDETFDNICQKMSENVLSTAATVQKKDGFVFLMFLNDAYLEMTKSFICHQPTLLKQTIFVTTSRQLTEQLQAWNPAITVLTRPYTTSKSVSYGTYEYFRLTEERLQFQNELIQNGIHVFVIEADATWNSLKIVDVIQHAFQEHDIVSADDDKTLISAGFLGIRSTDKTRTFFQQYVDTYSKKLESYRTRSGQIGDIGEQHTMTPLLKKLGIQVHWLSQCESANGKWYRQTNPDCPLPMVIQNNWIVGNSAKIKRAKENKQWFLDEKGQCKKGNELETIGASQVHSISGMGWVGTDPTKIKNSFSSLKTCQLKFSGFSLSSSKAIQFIGSNTESGYAGPIFVCDTFFCSGINGGNNGHEGTITNMHGYMAALGNPTKNEIMMDVGSNLGFYSLLDSKFGYRTMTFDPSTSCLYSTQGLAKINQLSDKIILNNVGVGYEPLNLQNSEAGCHINNHPTKTGGNGVKVLVRKLDELVTNMDGSNLLTDNRIVRLLKIDVEGGETKIVQGMNNLMQSGKVLNLIVELTPIHWNQAGLKKFSPMAAEHFAEMTTVHGYDAYMLYIQKPRHPPPSLSHIVSRVTKDHPINTYMKENNVDVEKYGIKIKNTGCEGSPFWKIHDMKKYILDYCVDWVGTAYPPSKGSCGNIWFTKSSSWTRDLIGQPEDNPIVNKLPSNLPCVDEPKKLAVMMTAGEQRLLESYMTPTTRYFEWGSGGSTDTYPRLTQGTVVSIENYKPWCDKVSSLPYVKCREREGTLHYKCIIPYPTTPYGYPEDAAHNGDFDEYINAIKDYPNFDVVLVDARWRVACALKALEYITDDTIVFMHDMGPKRKYYDAVFKWYDEVQRAGSLVAMRRRKGVKRPTKEEFTIYKYKPNW